MAPIMNSDVAEVINVDEWVEEEVQFCGAIRWIVPNQPNPNTTNRPGHSEATAISIEDSDSDDEQNIEVWDSVQTSTLMASKVSRQAKYHINHKRASHIPSSMIPVTLSGNFTGHRNKVWNNIMKPSALSAYCSKSTYPFIQLLNHQPQTMLFHAPGAINRIKQYGPIYATASAVIGGTRPDFEPYSHEGTLIICHNTHVYHLNGHDTTMSVSSRHNQHSLQSSTVIKHFTVNDIAFDPCVPYTLVSAAHDNTVKFWNCGNILEGIKPKLINTVECLDTPLKLSYKYQDSLLAIQAGNCILLHQNRANIQSRLEVTSQSSAVENFTWGRGPSAHLLCAATSENESQTGNLKIFDTSKEKMLCKINTAGSGECITSNETGKYLALTTTSSILGPVVTTFDVCRKESKALQQFKLEPHHSSSSETSLEVTKIMFSPDDIFLAVARNDNRVHIYDTRFLGKDVLYEFAHSSCISGSSEDEFGIVEIEWVSGMCGALGLVSGGADGCIRLWDIRTASEKSTNSEILADIDYGVGYFSIGDISKGEKQLIVGDNSGAIVVAE